MMKYFAKMVLLLVVHYFFAKIPLYTYMDEKTFRFLPLKFTSFLIHLHLVRLQHFVPPHNIPLSLFFNLYRFCITI